MAKALVTTNSSIPRESISGINGEEDFIQFLRQELYWPIPLMIDRLEDVAIPHDLQQDFGFSAQEDRIQVSRLLNLSENQPWGIFLFEFKTSRPYLTHLRRLLRVLGSQCTLRRGDPIWDRNDILFICTTDWRSYQFVHFSGELAESALISSFGWKGPDDRFLYTLCKHNLPKLCIPEPDPNGVHDPDIWRTQWRDAFNIKPVTDEFYATLKEVFHAVESGVTGLKGEQRRAFTELLVNRLVFLKFVEKKGWLDSDPDYLVNQFKQYGSKRFWKDFLFYLFFEGMNTDPSDRSPEAQRILGDVPYLNAELFALSEDWDDRQVDVSNGALDLLFDKLLNPYNFTVSETSPLEVEVAFNQDLLGYAYEELIADQHGQGAYYTHPTEVNLMCRESLRAYLETRCPQVDREQIGMLVYGELSLIGEQAPIPPEHAAALYTALHDVTICDPAVGSGTFPVAMVKHLFAIMRNLGQILANYGPFQDLIDQESLTDWRKGYELKLHIIERSIYGCDIDYFAVQIAKLRFWVELMVECENPIPLPNFDFKLLIGDALVSIVGWDRQGNPITLESILGHPTMNMIRSFDTIWVQKFANLKKKYYNTNKHNERLLFREEIRRARQKLIENLGLSLPSDQTTNKHVLWQIDMAEVFTGDRPGFDIVIGNPPYLRKEEIDTLFSNLGLGLTKKILQAIYNETLKIKISGHSDLYLYFYLRSISILKNSGGVLCFITSNAWLDVGYGSVLQQYLIEHTIIRAIIENRSMRSFAGADINTVIVICVSDQVVISNRKEYANFITVYEKFDSLQTKLINIDTEPTSHIDLGNTRVIRISHQELLMRGTVNNEFLGEKWGGKYLRGPNILHELLSSREFVALGEIADVNTYLNTGGRDDFFFINLHSHKGDYVEISSQKYPDQRFWIENKYVIPLVRSPSLLAKPLIEDEDLASYLLRIPHGEDLRKSKVEDYINWGEDMSIDKGKNNWWLLPVQAYKGYTIIISRHHHNHFNVYYNPDKFIANSFYGLEIKDHNFNEGFLFAYLSSTLGVLLSEIYGRTNQGQGVLNTYGEDIKMIPIFLPGSSLNWSRVTRKFLLRPFKDIVDDLGVEVQSGNIFFNQKCERYEIDDSIFNSLKFSTQERRDIMLGVYQLISSRLNRATAI